MLDQSILNYDPNTQVMMIGRPLLPAFLRTTLRRLGFPTPYDYLAHLIFARKSGQDIAAFYDNWDNNTDHDVLLDRAKHNQLIQARDELLFIFNGFLNTCPMTSFLIHTDIHHIEEFPDGLLIYYVMDESQMESTFQHGNLPWGYVHGTFVGH